MIPSYSNDGRKEIVLSVDYGMEWPLSDIFWSEPIRWSDFIDADLIARLKQWCTFFNENADYISSSFGSEENRKWFDLEGVSLLNDLDDAVGHEFKVRLKLWF